MAERCLHIIRPARTDLLESRRVADVLQMDVDSLLRFEAEVAGRVFRSPAGQLLIVDTCSPNASVDLEAKEMRKIIAHAIVEYLPPRQRIVVIGRFLEGRTLSDVAAELNVTVEEIGRLQSRAIARLKEVPALQALVRGR